MPDVTLVKCGVTGVPSGESHFRARPESDVDRARTLYSDGGHITRIANEIGVHHSTISRWISGSTRSKTVRVIARRVRN